MFKLKLIIILAILVFSLLSCSEYKKIKKSDDYNLKYNYALKSYKSGDYSRALQVFDELIVFSRGTDSSEKINYYYAKCYFYQGDFLQAGYYFLKFTQTFPTSKFAEECLYMSAYCQYLQTPSPSLDQTATYNAIKELQLFTDMYPNSKLIPECNKLQDELRVKLEKKAYDIARLYYQIESYQGAIVAFKNLLKDFPDTKYKEDAYYYIFLSSYYYAINSIESKKKQRYVSAREAYNAYKLVYPSSKYDNEAQNFYKMLQKKSN